MKTQNQMKNDRDKRRIKAAKKLFDLIKKMVETEQELICLGCIDSEIFDSADEVSVWIRKARKEPTPRHTPPFALTEENSPSGWVETDLHRAMGEMLLQKLQRKAPMGFETQGCSIRIQDNQCYFYISASMSLDALHDCSESSEKEPKAEVKNLKSILLD